MNSNHKGLLIVTYIFLMLLQLYLGVANFFVAYTYLVLGGISYSFVVLAFIHFVSLISNVISIIVCIVGLVSTNKDPSSPKVLNGYSKALLIPLFIDLINAGFMLFTTIMSILGSGATPQLSLVLIVEIIATSICMLMIALLIVSLSLNKTHQLKAKKATLISSAAIFMILGVLTMIGQSLNGFYIVALVLQVVAYTILIITTALFKYPTEEISEKVE